MNVLPAIVSVPVRAPPELDRPLYVTVAFPVPDVLLMTLNQLALLVTVQPQPAGAVSVTQFVPPKADIEALAGLMAYEHVDELPA